MAHILEVACLAALALPGLRAATSRAYRRVFPYDAIRLGAASVLYLAAVAALAWQEPAWLPIVTVVAGSVGAFLLWRARPSYGVSSGLPPGSLSPLPVRPWSDPEYYWEQARRHGDVFKTSQFGRPMVCIVGLERANRLLRDHDDQLVAPPLPFNRFIEGGYLRYLPEETHAQYRRIFRALFHSPAAARAEPQVAAAFRRGLVRMAEVSAADGSTPIRAPFMRMMFVAWSTLFYGIGDRHPDFERLKVLFHVIDIRKARWASRRRVEAALREIEAILGRRMRAFDPTDLVSPSCFLAALSSSAPQAIEDRTVMGNLIYIMQVTWGDVTGLLVWVFKMLCDNPAWRRRLAEEADRPDGDATGLATRIVLETLRLEQSESRYRCATDDLQVDGFRIPKGWLVRICVRESHRDERVFPEPLTFDPDRFLRRPLTRSEYAPFGAFRLACIGEDVTKRVAGRFALELATGFDWEVVEDGPPEINSWAHNAPNARLRVKLWARSPRP